MKLSSFLSIALSAAFFLTPLAGRAAFQAGAPATGLSGDVLQEINRVRTDPQAYADFLVTLRPFYLDNRMLEFNDGKVHVRTHEGVAALNEAIRSLRRTQPLPPLAYCPGLALSARDHALEQGQTGRTGHDGRNGSNPFDRMGRYGVWHTLAGENIAYGPISARQIVVNLVVDDGVPSRGHRDNLLKPAFGVAGVGVGEHPRYGRVCVIDFAGDFVAR